MRLLKSAALLALMLVGVLSWVGGTAQAQGLTQLDPVAPKYTLGSWAYEAPQFDGWRQLASSTRTLDLVYAERVDDERINTRIAVTLGAFDIPEEARPTADPALLAELSRRQQIKAREGQDLLFSAVEPVPGDNGLQTFSLVTRDGEGNNALHESFYVALAADRSEYLVVQMATQEMDFAGQGYFQQFFASLASLRSSIAQAAPEGASDDAASTDEAPAAAAGDGAPNDAGE